MGAASFAAAQLFRALPRVQLSRMVGMLCDQPLPPYLSRAIEWAFVRSYRVDLDEAEPRHSAYPSFDALFTRPLRAGARRVDDVPIVSPADGQVRAAGSLSGTGAISVKGNDYGIGELIGDPETADRLSAGSFSVIYLSPRDYHRVHSPVDGRVVRVQAIAGDLFPVNSIGERIPRLFVRNSRVVIHIETQALGTVLVVMVGALIVGRISVCAIPSERVPRGTHQLSSPVSVRKGDEIGTFHLGSTVVVLLEDEHPLVRAEQRVQYGQSLLRAS